jgi:hypothetical protein
MSKIHLHIERLSLPGGPGNSPAERRAFLAALEREIAARVAAEGTAAIASTGPTQLDVVRVSTPDLRPQSVARAAANGLDGGATTRNNGGRR